MNSGGPDSQFKCPKPSLDQMRELLPEFEVLPEQPLTCPGSYIIAWGTLEPCD